MNRVVDEVDKKTRDKGDRAAQLIQAIVTSAKICESLDIEFRQNGINGTVRLVIKDASSDIMECIFSNSSVLNYKVSLNGEVLEVEMK